MNQAASGLEVIWSFKSAREIKPAN